MSEQISETTLSADISKWAPIIYGRTYAVDFRFIVTPYNFEEKHKEFVWEYIKFTTRSAENLPGKPRWLFIKIKKHCIVGVTCMVKDLIGSHISKDSKDLDLTRDKLGRPLYAFVGYVSEDSTPSGIPAMNLELFAEPYKEFIPHKWQEIYADLGSKQETPQDFKSEYVKEFKVEELATPDPGQDIIPIEQLTPFSDDSIIFWNISHAKNIWFTVAQSRRNLSVCSGNLTKRDLITSEFSNAVIEEVRYREEENRIKVVDTQPLPPSENREPSEPSQENPSARSPRQIGNPDHRRERTQHGSNFRDDLIVNFSKASRSFFEAFAGEGATRQVDEIMLNVFTPLLGNETIDEIYARITELDEWEKRLIETINADLDKLHHLAAEIEELKKQGGGDKLAQKQAEHYRTSENLENAKTKLVQAQQLLARINKSKSRSHREDHPTQTTRTDKRYQADPNFGFREKEPSGEESRGNKQLSGETNTQESSKSKDIWEL
ncbi:hypothetical protein VB713_24130 [Anabaena cylindrica UHCC 0172]|uniref:hypothetical protein n=1 Tax=Anabaena cylindrica TaxID=1165 RepID=UPI002B20C93C|nr:hypothetical protein [Anabaena cylindrica]MEA5554032.1 hypothetical protein [Anabaena cylindrica UHCC 0172]